MMKNIKLILFRRDYFRDCGVIGDFFRIFKGFVEAGRGEFF